MPAGPLSDKPAVPPAKYREGLVGPLPHIRWAGALVAVKSASVDGNEKDEDLAT